MVGGEEWPVLCLSRKLSKRETRYSTVEKESLAIRWAVLTLRYYLLGPEFTLCSDHAPLQWLHRMKDTNTRITRWYLALQPFKVIHRPGVQMAVADFLSRNGGGGGGGGAAGRRAYRPETGGGGMRRGARGKAERARGRAGLETSGETFGKWMIINTCIWFQWLSERHKRAPPAGRKEGSSEHADAERDCQKSRRSNTHEEETAPAVFTFCFDVYFCY